MKFWRVALVWSVSMLFAVAANAESREHVVCYSAKPVKKACSASSSNAGQVCDDDVNCPGGLCEKQLKFPKGLAAVLNDDTDPQSVGENKTFDVKKLKQVCIPVDKNGEGVDDPDTFWTTYALKQSKSVCTAGANQGSPCKDVVEDCGGVGACQEVTAKFDKKASRNINVFVEDQYSNIRLDASKVDLLMVPATLCDGNDNATCVSGANAAPAAGTQEHYKCYKAKATKKVCAAGNVNEFQACAKDDDCGFVPGACVKLDKFAKGQSATVSDSVPGLNDGRTFDVAKLTHVCKAVEKTVVPGGTPEGPVNTNSRLICYKSKGSKGQCAGGPNGGLPCKKDEQCPFSTCAVQAKYDKTNTLAQGLYVNDQFDLVDGAGPTEAGDYHRLNLAKEEMFCMPACENPDEILDSFSYTPDVLRIATIQIPSTGHVGDGQDVDNNPGTCQPSANCAGSGIDNVLGVITGTIPEVNTALQDAVTNGTFNLVLEIDQFAAGSQVVHGYASDLDTPPGCTDVNDGGQVCNYSVGAEIVPATCEKAGTLEFPVTVGSVGSSPTVISGGGIGSDFFFSLPFAGTPLNITAHNVKAGLSVVHGGGSGTITSASGALGGAISARELRYTILSLPDGLCVGGENDGGGCTEATATKDCGNGITCDTFYLGGFMKTDIVTLLDFFLVRDIDLDGAKTCEGGTDPPPNNDGEPCVNDGDCPDGVGCDQYDAYSVGIKFTAIDAAITSASHGCDKATCSLY